jgi:hypothetical protein
VLSLMYEYAEGQTMSECTDVLLQESVLYRSGGQFVESKCYNRVARSSIGGTNNDNNHVNICIQ